MDTRETLLQTFMDVLHLSDKEEIAKLNYRQKGWDSTTHMLLIIRVEENFGITFEPEDVFEFKSFDKGIELITKIMNR